jgi:hypothetical protein
MLAKISGTHNSDSEFSVQLHELATVKNTRPEFVNLAVAPPAVMR